MPTAAKNASPASSPQGPGFEAALHDLETIVEAMESEDLPLDTLLRRYEEGVELAQVCQSRLAEAEQRVLQLEKNIAGEFRLKPLDSAPSET